MSSSSVICPLRFASEVDFQGIKTKTHCIGEECAWYLEGNCCIRVIAVEFISKLKHHHHGPAAD